MVHKCLFDDSECWLARWMDGTVMWQQTALGRGGGGEQWWTLLLFCVLHHGQCQSMRVASIIHCGKPLAVNTVSTQQTRVLTYEYSLAYSTVPYWFGRISIRAKSARARICLCVKSEKKTPSNMPPSPSYLDQQLYSIDLQRLAVPVQFAWLVANVRENNEIHLEIVATWSNDIRPPCACCVHGSFRIL